MAIILTTNTMGLLTMFCFGCLTICSAGKVVKATQCQGDQHCSECDNITGHCITECDPGYYDHRCTSMCNKNCKNKNCLTAYTGNGYCIEGCVPGYQGPGCGKPCYIPGDNCTACPGGCDGGYCRLGPSCVSGCVDSYYGTGCKNCSSGCTTCNRTTGTCDKKTDENAKYIRVVIVGSSLVTVVCVLVTSITLFMKYLNKKRSQEYITPTQDMHVSPEATGAPVYDEVDEAKMHDALTDEGRQASGAGYVELRSNAHV